MACFTVLDPTNFGFIAFDQIHKFMKKYDPKVNNSHINSVLRRLNEDEDFKISYVEFADNIAPKMQGFEQKGCTS